MNCQVIADSGIGRLIVHYSPKGEGVIGLEEGFTVYQESGEYVFDSFGEEIYRGKIPSPVWSTFGLFDLGAWLLTQHELRRKGQ